MKKIIAVLLSLTFILACFTLPASAESKTQLETYIEQTFEARKSNDSLGKTILGSNKFTNEASAGSSSASSTYTDWMAFAMARYSTVYSNGKIDYKYDDGSGYSDYLKAMKNYVTKTYSENEGMLSSVKSTEWHRAVFTVTALGGDAESFGEYKSKAINLVADGTYNCVVSHGPSRQGLNGMICALLAENIKDFSIPSTVSYSAETMITYILKQQLSDGGWSLNSTSSDPDITALAIESLSTYYSDSKSYTYTNVKTNKSQTKTVKQIIDSALKRLSSLQKSDGDFASNGTLNAESTAQVLVALTGLNIDPLTDSRFIKSGKTVVDGLLKYRLSDGGFTHSYQTDSSNTSAVAGKYNYMANDQASYSLVAYWRYVNGKNSLYNMRYDEEALNIFQKIGVFFKSIFAFIKKIFTFNL